MAKITIYGFGYVGRALWRFLKDHYEVQVYDPRCVVRALLDACVRNPEDPEVEEAQVISEETEIKPTKYAVVCVPTPPKKDGSCDTSAVENIIRESSHDFYLIKSTVVPGTTKRLAEETDKKIAFSPEYLGEGKYEIPFWQNYPHPTNMRLHTFHIFGGPAEVTKEFINLWQKVAGWHATYHQTDSTTAELVKYMENAFLATKKIFCDEFYDIAEKLGVDYNELVELWLLDGRIGRTHTRIFPDNRGFGGKCLPKDVKAIAKHMEKKGYEPKLLKQVLSINKRLRKKQIQKQRS